MQPDREQRMVVLTMTVIPRSATLFLGVYRSTQDPHCNTKARIARAKRDRRLGGRGGRREVELEKGVKTKHNQENPYLIY